MTKPILMLFAVLFVFSGLSMAQNCGGQFPCKVDQTSANTITAQNADDFCFFVQGPESIGIACYQQGVLKLTIQKNFWAHECFTSNFLNTEVQWSICRIGNSINVFSWDITAGTLEKTGTF